MPPNTQSLEKVVQVHYSFAYTFPFVQCFTHVIDRLTNMSHHWLSTLDDLLILIIGDLCKWIIINQTCNFIGWVFCNTKQLHYYGQTNYSYFGTTSKYQIKLLSLWMLKNSI